MEFPDYLEEVHINNHKGETMEIEERKSVEEFRKEKRIKELNADIERLEASKDKVCEWVAQQEEKVAESTERYKYFSDETNKKLNKLNDLQKE